ncbi:MAG TPA: hypothetical protein VEF76_07610 [Patescibacteria group bacterium]|nr:hypothetical protein [Patescibacteria group bacterium]
MNKLNAASLMQAVASLDAPLAALDQCIAAMPAGKDRDRMGHAIGEIMDLLTKNFVAPVIQKFPDLDLDK